MPCAARQLEKEKLPMNAEQPGRNQIVFAVVQPLSPPSRSGY
jgi:hypothetical protein